jgi:hypothetical protein
MDRGRSPSQTGVPASDASLPGGGALGTEIFHVVPVQDWVVHEEQRDICVCGPHVEYFPGSTVIVHHALDGRHAADPTWPRRRATEVARIHLRADEPA